MTRNAQAGALTALVVAPGSATAAAEAGLWEGDMKLPNGHPPPRFK